MINIPTIQTLRSNIIADFQATYGNTISPVGKVFLRAVAWVWAAQLRLQYINVGRLQKNIFVDTADPESEGGTLERFGRVKLGRDRFQAVAGQYNVIVTGSVGAVIPSSTTFKSDDSSLSPGYLFVLDNAYTMVSASDTITLRALTTGIESKLNIGDTLTATSPIALVDSVSVVGSISVQPLEAESIEDYRQKIENSYRLEPQGGAGTDYRIWASDAQGVRIVYPYAKSNAICEVDVYVEANIADSTDGKGTPGSLMLTDVYNVISFNPNVTLATNERGRRPLDVIINPLPITVMNVDININGYMGLTPAIQTQLFNALKALTDKIRPYVDTTDLPSEKNDILDNNKVINAILNQTPGATFGTITISVNSVPVPSYTFILGNIPYLNSVTYV